MNSSQYPFGPGAWKKHLRLQSHQAAVKALSNKSAKLKQNTLAVYSCHAIAVNVKHWACENRNGTAITHPVVDSANINGAGAILADGQQKCAVGKNTACGGIFHDATANEAFKTGIVMMATYSSFSGIKTTSLTSLV